MFLSNKKTELQRLEEEAEEFFSNYDGYDDSYDEEYDEEYDEDYDDDYDAYDDEYDVPTGKLSTSDKTLSIVVTNSNAVPTLVPIFGAFKNLSSPNFNVPAGVTVVAPDSSYAQVLNETASAPMAVRGIKMTVSNVSQFAYSLNFVKKESSGYEERDPLQPSRYTTAAQFNPNIAEMPGVKFPIDGKVELQLTVDAGVTVTFIFYIASKVDLTRLAQGKSVLKTARPSKKRRRGLRK